MRSRYAATLLTLGSVAFASVLWSGALCAQSADGRIRQLLHRVEEGYRAADVDLVARAMTDDVILLPSGAVAVHGEDAVRARYQTYFRRGGIALVMNPQEIRMGDGWAIVRGTMSGQRADATDEDGMIVGKFMMVVDRQPDGSYLLSRLIWNDDPEP